MNCRNRHHCRVVRFFYPESCAEHRDAGKVVFPIRCGQIVVRGIRCAVVYSTPDLSPGVGWELA